MSGRSLEGGGVNGVLLDRRESEVNVQFYTTASFWCGATLYSIIHEDSISTLVDHYRSLQNHDRTEKGHSHDRVVAYEYSTTCRSRSREYCGFVGRS